MALILNKSSKSTDTKIVGMCKKCLPNYVEVKGFKNFIEFCNSLKKKTCSDVFEEYRAHLKQQKNIFDDIWTIIHI